MTGILAIWNDCAAGREAEYEVWYQGQHLPERVGIPGFLRGRRYRILRDGPGYFTYYETETPGVLTSPAYLARVNDPTPETRSMMADGFRNMSRTICERVALHGRFRGAFAVTVATAGDIFPDVLPGPELPPDIARAELWRAVPDDTPTNAEQKLRGPDQRIGRCLLVETLTEQAAERVANELSSACGSAASVYGLLCELEA